ncbi:MAG: EamA family transporter [Acidobacteria bacterium]|nr:EamA family transporter [Acidobacteriota bacterium]
MTPLSTHTSNAVGTGTAMAVGAMCAVQLGLAASVDLSAQVGAEGVAWLRLSWAAIILLALARPWRTRWNRSTLIVCVLLGVVTAGMTMFFMAAVETLPLGTASALEFLGPLSVSVFQGRGKVRLWALVAVAGVLALTEPWRGAIELTGILFALGAALCWACYIVLTQRAGDSVEGLRPLAVSMPVAALVATFTVGPSVFGRMDMGILLLGIGLAVLLPVLPFSLELMALRRLNAASFGTLMSLEPAIAAIIGATILAQIPRVSAVVGIILVVSAGVGAARMGARPAQPVLQTAT